MPCPSQFLVSIELNKCNIPETGGILLAHGLMSSNTTLCKLYLSNNTLGNKRGEALGELLAFNRTLTDVDLSWNQIKVSLGARPRLVM